MSGFYAFILDTRSWKRIFQYTCALLVSQCPGVFHYFPVCSWLIPKTYYMCYFSNYKVDSSPFSVFKWVLMKSFWGDNKTSGTFWETRKNWGDFLVFFSFFLLLVLPSLWYGSRRCTYMEAQKWFTSYKGNVDERTVGDIEVPKQIFTNNPKIFLERHQLAL